jgi:hypothetical protein
LWPCSGRGGRKTAFWANERKIRVVERLRESERSLKRCGGFDGLGCHERDNDSGLSGPGGAPCPVCVVLVVGGGVELHYPGYPVDMNTARRDISRDQGPNLATAELSERSFALVL